MKHNILTTEAEQPLRDEGSPRSDNESCVVVKSFSELGAGDVPKFLRDSTVNEKIFKVKLHIPLKEEKKDSPDLPTSSHRNSPGTLSKNIGSNVYTQSSGVSTPHEIMDYASHWVIENALNPLYPLSIPDMRMRKAKNFDEQLYAETPVERTSAASPVLSERSSVCFEDTTEETNDDEDLLNRSMEVPIHDTPPVFTETEPMENIAAYLRVNDEVLSNFVIIHNRIG